MPSPPATAATRSAGARLTLTRAVRLLETRRVTSVELCSYCHELAEIGDRPHPAGGGGPSSAGDGTHHDQSSAQLGPGLGLNAFAQLSSRDELLRHASESDRRRDAGLSLGALDGVPISVKANIAVEGWALTAASRILNGWDYHGGDDDAAGVGGCGFDADVVHRLRTSGAVLVGTTNLDEFGMGSGGTYALPPRHVRRRLSLQDGQASWKGGSLVRNPLPYLQHLVPSFVSNIEDDDEHDHPDEDELDDLWAHHVTTPLHWRHPDLLPSLPHPFDSEQQSHPTLSAGGSSSGSAASVSLGSSLLSIGTDTGGSVRLPAAWTGVVGFKPTYGLISRFGLVSYASSLDTVGVLVPSAQDAALVFDVVANRDGGDERCSGERDSTSISVAVNASVSESLKEKMDSDKENESDAERPLRGLTVGIPSSFSVAECPPIIRQAWQIGAQRLRDAGALVRTISPSIVKPDTVKTSLAAYYVLACAEASSNLARYDGVEFGWDGPDDDDDAVRDTYDEDDSVKTALSDLTPLESRFSRLRAHGFGPEVIRRILCGTSVLSSDRFHTHFEAAARVRAVMSREFNAAFDDSANGGDGVDLMLVPTALSPPPDLGVDGCKAPDATEMLANDVMTVPISLAGLPSVSVPVRLKEGEENNIEGGSTIVGLQVFGPRLSEGQVLLAARALEDGA